MSKKCSANYAHLVGDSVLRPFQDDKDFGNVIIPQGLKIYEHEKDTSRRLARCGLNVRWRELRHGDRLLNPDVIIAGQIWEIKSPKGNSKHTISGQFDRATKQGAIRLILDGARSALDDNYFIQEAQRQLNFSKQIVEVMVISKNGTITSLFPATSV